MKTYDVNWNGLDRGHEGAWSPDVWRDVLNAIAKYSPVDLDDTGSQFYAELATRQPSTQWVTVSSTGDARTFFRDGREPWASTGVVSFNKVTKTAALTSVGRQVVEGKISYADVLASAALGLEEKGEHPFEIILDAMRRAPLGVGLAYEDVVRVMRHYRSGDDIVEVLNSPSETISANSGRRLKAILLLMTYSGLAVHKGNLYYAGQDVTSLRILAGADLREAFKNWITQNNAEGSGKAATYITALEDADIIAQAFNEKFKLPSVYEMSNASLESLREFIASEQNLESHAVGSSVFNGVAGLHGKSYWHGGHCGAAIGALLEFKRNLREEKHAQSVSVNDDSFSAALRLFKEQRTTWTSSFIGEGAVYSSVNTEVRSYFGDVANWNVETLAGAEAFKEFCIKHTWMLKNGNGAWASLSTYTNEQRKVLVEWIDSRIVKQAKPLSEVVVDDNGFKGLTNKAVTELLMKFHPGQYCLCNGPTLEALKTLMLIDDGVSEKFTYNDYMQVMGACANVLARLKSANIHATVDGTDDPDYIVVNEFLYFVSENYKEIKDEVIKMAAKPAERNPYNKTKGKTKTFKAESKEDQLMLRILASLRTKPFVILAGHSGTGKSRMVKKLAYMTCRDNKLHEGSDPGNYCIIEVKPNWHDSTELLGYFSSFGRDHYVTKQLVEFIMKAYAYPDVPFFVCLDEMNLAPVEQYFAEFLSALEDIHEDEGKMNEFFDLNDANKPDGDAAKEVVKYTSAPLIKPIDYKDDIAMLEPKTTQAMDWLKTHGLTIPKNLFVVGTVNMDESTNQFSRKVLDRAFTIEMTDARFEDFGDADKDPLPTFAKEDEIDHVLIDNLLTGKKQAGKLSTRGTDATQPKAQLENMNDLKSVLAGTPFVVAYRFANEYALYEDALNVLDVLADGASEADKAAKKIANAKRAFDDAVLMKLLPRIAGERAVVTEIFKGREQKGERAAKDGLLKFLEYDKEQQRGTASGEKMTEILDRGNVPYLTFWP